MTWSHTAPKSLAISSMHLVPSSSHSLSTQLGINSQVLQVRRQYFITLNPYGLYQWSGIALHYSLIRPHLIICAYPLTLFWNFSITLVWNFFLILVWYPLLPWSSIAIHYSLLRPHLIILPSHLVPVTSLSPWFGTSPCYWSCTHCYHSLVLPVNLVWYCPSPYSHLFAFPCGLALPVMVVTVLPLTLVWYLPHTPSLGSVSALSLPGTTLNYICLCCFCLSLAAKIFENIICKFLDSCILGQTHHRI